MGLHKVEVYDMTALLEICHVTRDFPLMEALVGEYIDLNCRRHLKLKIFKIKHK
jgi:hypothetical protein